MEDKKELAFQYYIRKEKSLSKCAEIAGVSVEEFIELLSKKKISIFNLDEEDIRNA